MLGILVNMYKISVNTASQKCHVFRDCNANINCTLYVVDFHSNNQLNYQFECFIYDVSLEIKITNNLPIQHITEI
jgi:hypothetical protein